ncbi:unnamed protein product, partial [Prorocentrum cordatum]
MDIQQLSDQYQEQLADLNAAHSLLQVDQQRLAEMLYVDSSGGVTGMLSEDVRLFKDGLDFRLQEFEESCARIQDLERRLQEKIDEATTDYEQTPCPWHRHVHRQPHHEETPRAAAADRAAAAGDRPGAVREGDARGGDETPAGHDHERPGGGRAGREGVGPRRRRPRRRARRAAAPRAARGHDGGAPDTGQRTGRLRRAARGLLSARACAGPRTGR